MSHPAQSIPWLSRIRPGTRALALLSLVLSSCVALAVPFAIDSSLGFTLLAVVVVLFALGFVLWIFEQMAHLRSQRVVEAVAKVVSRDQTPCIATDADGRIAWRNSAAESRYGTDDDATLSRILRGVYADPARVIFRLKLRADKSGAAHEDVILRRGHFRVSVHSLGLQGHLWRLEEITDVVPAGRGAESIGLPMMTVAKSGTILFMNEALRRVIGSRVSKLDRVFADLPVRPGQINQVSTEQGNVPVLVSKIEGSGGRQELYLLPAHEGPVGTGVNASDWQLFEHLPIALMRLKPDGEVLLGNRAARLLLDDPIHPGTAMNNLVEGLGRSLPDWLTAAADGRADGRPEVLRAVKARQDLYLQVTLGRIVENGTVTLVAVMNDATELKTLEAQFVQSQKMQAIGQLAGGVAHDFNNLLTAISGHCDLLLLRQDEGDPDYGDLIQIHQNANRAAALVGQLLAFSRKQNLQPEVIDLRDALGDLGHLLNRLVGERTTLTVRHAPDVKSVRADKRQLEQVMMNLVLNARDAMPEGGDIRIETAAISLSEAQMRDNVAVQPGEYVTIRVTDQGVGIPKDCIGKVFEPFFSTKRTGEGTGLGLSTVYGIVKQTGGYIFVDSEVGSGTCFTVYFPAAKVESVDMPVNLKPVIRRVAHQAEGVVLLVEDEAPVRAFASRALRMRGYTVLEAENAEDALKMLEDPELSVDVFVTDVIMPGMDGPSWVKRALAKRPKARVVFMSGYSEESFESDQAQIPNSKFLPKPFSLNDLTATVHDVMH